MNIPRDIIPIVEEIIAIASDFPDEYSSRLDCRFELPAEILALLNRFGLEFRLIQHLGDPSIWLQVFCGSFAKGSFQIKYQYNIYFSKLAMVWKHEFSSRISHPDPERITGGTIYVVNHIAPTILQQNFEKQLGELLSRLGYLLLSDQDLKYVVLSLPFPAESFRFFGPQPSADMILFTPFWHSPSSA